MKKNKMLLLGLAVLAIAGMPLLVILLRQDNPSPRETPEQLSAPRLLSPPDGTVFVTPDVALRWEWSPPLASNQFFALRLWYGDQAPVEVWTRDTTFDAQTTIDSFSRDLGTFYWEVAAVNTTETGDFESMGSAWSPIYSLERVRRLIPTAYPEEQQSDLARLIASQGFTTRTEIIDYTRHLIWAHSSLEGQDSFKPDYSDAAEMIYANIQGQGEMPRLLCDGRSTTMLTILQELGIESRLIFLYGDADSVIDQHTVLEVFNPDTQEWEIHDASYDIFFKDTESGGRASIERLVFGPFDTIAACDGEGNCSHAQAEEYAVYYQAFRYGYTDTFWVNPDRFDVSKRFPSNGNVNLAELLTGNPRDFSFRFDSWTGGQPE